MAEDSTQLRKAQLDKKEREHLEGVVTEMRERVEANVRYQLESDDLEVKPDVNTSLSDEQETLVEAIELEGVGGHDWADSYEQFITGVGYTIVNRLAALRCLEVRGFIDEKVTRFREDGLTPAADRLVTEEFMLEAEAVLEAYRNECDALADEIEILFDRSTAYSLLDPDEDTFEDLCTLLDAVPDEVWRADDVLGWVYEYYNVTLLDDLRRKGDREGLEPEDVPPANQFYTPHWVVRMLTDNSLGKLYLEARGDLQATVERQDSLSPEERKNRPLSPDDSPGIADFCTYLVPSEEEGEPPAFEGPEDIRVIDPACGSGHFLLYAFDVLERIWRVETDLNPAEIPQKILRHNLYGVDLDMRACQLAAFNLYLKGRTRATAEGASGVEMPDVGIVCADAKVADTEGVEDVFDDVAGGKADVEDALRRILDAFEEVHGLGSLLDVRGTLGDLFEDDSEQAGVQITLADDPREDHSLGQILGSLREAVEEHQNGDSFLAQDLRSFVRLLDVLAQDYDVALMNPPYGARNRMPESVRVYTRDRFEYSPEFYINFFEVCDKMTVPGGRIGMLVPWSFMFKNTFQQFREDFVGKKGGFDFLCEFGYDILDNAMVGTVGTVVQTGSKTSDTGTFIRLHDLTAKEKEQGYLSIVSGKSEIDVRRFFEISLDTFRQIPQSPICYSIPEEVLQLHDTEMKLDADSARIEGSSVGNAANGMNTGDNNRFLTYHWEATDDFIPYAKGGTDAWIVPISNIMINWSKNGKEVKRFSGSVIKNSHLYGREGLTWTYAKRTGRRFGYFPAGGAFDGKGSMYFADNTSIWKMMGVLNSSLYHNLFLSLTPERDWQVGDVGRIPWRSELEVDEVGRISKEQFRLMSCDQIHNPISQYYIGPELLPTDSVSGFFYNHPHTREHQISDFNARDSFAESTSSIVERTRATKQNDLLKRRRLEDLAEKIDAVIYKQLDISEQTQHYIEQEIFLRTNEDPEDRQVPDPESVPEVPENIDEQVKDLVHHFAMEAVREEDDGIIPVDGASDQPDMLARIVERFEDAYGEYADDRLVEVDGILGTESAADEAYPNLRAFIADDLFEYHVERMENTPIVWKLTTERLLADATGEGFACFLDYHQLDISFFDRLRNQYLEPRKTELRERRAAANRRQNDESLSTSERAVATDEFERCSSALEQIAELEDVMQELGSTSERDFDDEDRELVRELAPKVAAFRAETAERIETLATLRERNGEAWFQDTFSDGFWDKVDEWREEWLDALAALETACEEYARPSDEPVAAHLADLFDYFNWRLKGSDHYSSTGILFMTYYFEREGAALLDESGEPFDTLTDEERLLASLATGVDTSVLDQEYLEQFAHQDDDDVDDVSDRPPLAGFKALAEEIADRCQTVSRQLPSDWTTRALAEITTAGYQPNQKHGVAINITPLAEKHVVPAVVEKKVL